MPGMPQNSGKGFYRPGGIEQEYSRIQSQPSLPGVAPPQGTEAEADRQAAAFVPSTPIDPNAPDILDLIQGGRFKTPFTVTLQRRAGTQVFKSDAGTKTEANYELCKETIREPADLLRIIAGVQSEIYKPLNRMTIEFQLMLYLAYEAGTLDVPPRPEPEAPVAVEAQTETPAEQATAEAS